MAKPLAYFSYSKNAKVLSFKDLSFNVPTSYLWDFGDGTTSVEKSPVKAYTETGFYTVTLTATNADGDSDPLALRLGVGVGVDTLNISLLEYIDIYIPEILVTELNTSEKLTFINKWQSYLQPLVDKPYKISPINTTNELAWPALVNTLIAQLAALDLTKVLAQRAMNLLLTGINSGTNGENEGVKKITTGPTEVEFQDESDDASNQSKLLSNLLDPDSGIITSMTGSICMLASRLRIWLPMCPRLSKPVFAPTVAHISHRHGYGSLFSTTLPNTYLPLLGNKQIKRLGMFKNIGLDYSNTSAKETRVDASDVNYYYYGFLYEESPEDFWRIIRVPANDIHTSYITDSTNNIGLSFNDAWSNPDLLNY